MSQKVLHPYSLLQALRELQFITPRGIVRWARAIASEGINLMALLRFASETYPHHRALIFEEEEWSYSQLLKRAYEVAHHLQEHFQIGKGSQVIMLCRNHTESLLSIFALSRLGADLYLLNSDFTTPQVENYLTKHPNCQLLITDQATPLTHPIPTLTAHDIKEWPHGHKLKLPKARQGGLLSLLTGGSSGKHTEASRKPSATAFLPPLMALLKDIGIHRRRSVYIPLPLYHGFGLATLFVSFVMGKEVWLTRHFSTEVTLAGIQAHQIEVMVLVPTMLYRLLTLPDAATKLSSLCTLISGGDRLTVTQAKLCHEELPQARLFNLYGTSEAGFFMLATPEQINSATNEVPIGQPISGVQCQIRDTDAHGVGHLWVASRWAMASRQGRWQDTGDLAYMDSQGLYYHRGRADRMVVCGGENIHLDSLEQLLTQHPYIANVKAYAISDPRLGDSIGFDIEVKKNQSLTELELRQWLKGKVTRRAMPSLIQFKDIETTSTGKRITKATH